MRTRHSYAVVVVTLVALCLAAAPARAQDDKPAAMPDEKQMMEMMEAAAKVGPQHEQIKKHFAGTWECDVTFYMGPNEQKSTGTMKGEMMFDGRYLHNLFEGSWDGRPFQGAGVMGYDNTKQKYFSTWMDSMSTGLMVSEGTYDEATKTYTLTGKTIGMDGKEATVREVTRIESDDRHVFQMYMPGMDGKETKVMEIVYARKK